MAYTLKGKLAALEAKVAFVNGVKIIGTHE